LPYNARAKILGVIPARYGSTRFPGKPLALIAGQSLIQRVWRQAYRAKRLDGLVVATDDERILEHVQAFGGQAVLTQTEHPSGTDRVGEVARQGNGEYYVNIQGDEPLLPPSEIDRLVDQTVEAKAPMSTLVRALDLQLDQDDIHSPHVVKVVRNLEGWALYFSRAPIPHPRRPEAARWFKHVGVYIYHRETLLELCSLPPTPLEHVEGLEQLRALEHGVRILTVETDYNPIGVDTEADIALVERELAR
jgi:3-deoxy-manno-octulosonate cytidylyltransferase (CMP-KDO synthetase)